MARVITSWTSLGAEDRNSDYFSLIFCVKFINELLVDLHLLLLYKRLREGTAPSTEKKILIYIVSLIDKPASGVLHSEYNQHIPEE
jgi:hypothetical protein